MFNHLFLHDIVFGLLLLNGHTRGTYRKELPIYSHLDKLHHHHLSGYFSVGWMKVLVKMEVLVSLAEILPRCEMQ